MMGRTLSLTLAGTEPLAVASGFYEQRYPLATASGSVSLFLTRAHHRFKNLHVPSAATEISGQAIADLCFIRIRKFLEQTQRSQNHSRRTDAALRAATFNESLLYRVQLI